MVRGKYWRRRFPNLTSDFDDLRFICYISFLDALLPRASFNRSSVSLYNGTLKKKLIDLGWDTLWLKRKVYKIYPILSLKTVNVHFRRCDKTSSNLLWLLNTRLEIIICLLHSPYLNDTVSKEDTFYPYYYDSCRVPTIFLISLIIREVRYNCYSE